MRKVIVRIYDRELKKWVDALPGVFHCWGCAYEEFHSGPGNYSIAIVELLGGRVVSVLPEDVKFVE